MAKDQATIFLQQLLNVAFQHMEDNEFAKMMLKNIIDDEEENQICYQTTLTHQQFKEFKSVWQKHANTIKQWINYGKLKVEAWWQVRCAETYVGEYVIGTVGRPTSSMVNPFGRYQRII